MSYTVEQRRREIGIRMALGAAPARLVGCRGARGRANHARRRGVGLAAALLAARVLEAFLFGVSPRDPITLTIASLAAARRLGRGAPRFRRYAPRASIRSSRFARSSGLELRSHVETQSAPGAGAHAETPSRQARRLRGDAERPRSATGARRSASAY